MRSIKYSELNLKNDIDEEDFYNQYLNSLNSEIQNDIVFKEPEKRFEIVQSDILDGKVLLLKSEYINSNSNIEKDIFYDYSIAFQVYNIILDIEEGLQVEEQSIDGLYEYQRTEYYKEIQKLKEMDEELLKKKKEEYDIIKNSNLYKEFCSLKQDYIKLEKENEELRNKIETKIAVKKVGFFEKIISFLKGN